MKPSSKFSLSVLPSGRGISRVWRQLKAQLLYSPAALGLAVAQRCYLPRRAYGWSIARCLAGRGQANSNLSDEGLAPQRLVQVFGCRRHQPCPHARAAGVQKAPRHEVAGSRAVAGRRAAMGISGLRRIRWRCGVGATRPACLRAAGRGRVEEASRRGVERYRRAPGAWIALNRAGRDRRRRGANAPERGCGGARRKSGS